MTPPEHVRPVGWCVVDGKGGAALFLERAQADQFAVRVHGTVDALYSGLQLAALLDLAGQPAAADARANANATSATPPPEEPRPC